MDDTGAIYALWNTATAINMCQNEHKLNVNDTVANVAHKPFFKTYTHRQKIFNLKANGF